MSSVMGDFKKSYEAVAELLGDYKSMSIEELANGFCKAMDEEDEFNKDLYCAALMLRFWHNIKKLYVSSPGIGLEKEDFCSWLGEAIMYACKPNYRAWQKPEKNCNAQQAINKCISTIRLQHYYEYNLDKHKSNFRPLQLDSPFNDEDETTLIDTICDESYRVGDYKSTKDYDVIQKFLNNKKIVEAIVIDNIANQDPFRHDKKVFKEKNEDEEEVKYTEYYTEFWPYKLVQILSNLPQDYFEYFSKKYTIPEKDLQAALGAVKKANNQKLYKYVDKALADLKVVWGK